MEVTGLNQEDWMTVGRPTELLFISDKAMFRFKNAIVTRYTISHENHRSYGSRMGYGHVSISSGTDANLFSSLIDFKIEGTCQPSDLVTSYSEFERVEIVKRLDAYPGLKD